MSIDNFDKVWSKDINFPQFLHIVLKYATPFFRLDFLLPAESYYFSLHTCILLVIAIAKCQRAKLVPTRARC